MADKEISDLTAGTDPKAALFHGVQGVNSRQFTGDVIGHQFRGARVRMNADDTGQNLTTEGPISFDAAEFDTDSFFSGGAPTKLTIPAGLGITYVELTGQVNISVTTGDSYSMVSVQQYNSSNVNLKTVGNRAFEKSVTFGVWSVSTGPLEVSDGDYFTLTYREETDNSITIEGNDIIDTFLAIKVIGMEPV